MWQRKNQSGFGSVELLFALAVVVVIAVASLIVYQHHKNGTTSTAAANSSQTSKQQKSTTTTQPVQDTASNTSQAYQRTTTVPANWKTYQNAQYHISFSYPANWQISPDSKGNPDQFDYEIGLGASHQSYDALIGIKAQPLAEKVAVFKGSYTILSDKKITIDSNQAEELRYKNGGFVERQYFVFAHNITYQLPTVYESDGDGSLSAKDSLTLFESVKID